jgi:putative intracellular protease/amidase
MTNATVHLALVDSYSDWEVGYLAAHLAGIGDGRDSGFRLRTVGLRGEPVTTQGGMRVLPDISLEDLDPADSAMLVLPGSDAWHGPDAEPWIGAARRHLSAGVPIAAICGATFGLAAAGLLDERRHTSNDPAYLAMSGYAGAEQYVDEPAVIDGDVVTASGVAPVHFAQAIFTRLEAHRPERLDAWFKLYAERDPAAYHQLVSA